MEDRIQRWPIEKLTGEGFTMLDLAAFPRGNLFQEKVFRFSMQYSDEKLPSHQFTVGDCVRITGPSGDPLSMDSIDGVLLDRRQKYLDICLNNADASRIDTSLRYRLDTMVNRVTFDRQIEALQSFLTPPVPGVLGVSRAVRDIMLYSYPNSMIQLANTPGGLKMALPMTDTTNSPELEMGGEQLLFRDNEIDGKEGTQGGDQEISSAISAVLNKGREMTGMKSKSKLNSKLGDPLVRGRGNEGDNAETERLLEAYVAPVQQLQQQLFARTPKGKVAYESVVDEDVSGSGSNLIDSTNKNTENSADSINITNKNNLGSQVTVAEALSNNLINEFKTDGSTQFPVDITTVTPLIINQAVFETNTRLRSMAEQFAGSTKIQPYTADEINRAILIAEKKCPMNQSQLESLKKAITQTVTLVQGPPGTGKTRTACAMVAVTGEFLLCFYRALR